MKKTLLFLLLLGIVTIGKLMYDDICESSPECACKKAPPNDPTCH